MRFRCGSYLLNLAIPRVMGIVNVTPDSFSDGGRYHDTVAAIEHGLQLVIEGADILDIGGESTRPGAHPVAVQEELDRVLPVIEGLVQRVAIPVSIDTAKPEVMRSAIAAGAAMVNDVRALQEPGAWSAVAESQVGICLMHMRGVPETMQQDVHYDNVVVEVREFLAGRLAAAHEAGITTDRVLLDPGFGFGKRTVHNLALLQHLDSFLSLGAPLLVGLSRKSVLGDVADIQDSSQRVSASVAAAVIAVTKGARMVRVHDVKATKEALRVWERVYETSAA